MKVVLSGYFGFGNIGDEAILEAMIGGLRSRDPRIEITVLSADPDKTSEQFKVYSVPRLNLSRIVHVIKKADVLISGGGGLLQDVTGPFSIPYYLGLIYLAKAWGRPVAVIGQGVGPVKGFLAKILTRWILNKVDLIVVRDEESFSELRSLKVKRPIFITGDVTTILEPIKPDARLKVLKQEGIAKGEKPLVGFSIRKPSHRLTGAKAGVYHKIIADFADGIIEKYNARVVFIPFLYPDDIIESSNIINRMRNPVNVIIREYNTSEIMGIVGEMDILIGMRLHSHIFAAMTGVPMLGISYDPKVAIFLHGLGQNFINVADVEKERLFLLFEKTWAKRGEIKESLTKKLPELKEKGLRNFDVFFDHFKYYKISAILGVEFDNINLSEAIEKIEGFIKSGKPHLIVTPNPEMVIYSLKDEEFRNILNGADLRLPDGIGIVFASRILESNVKERVSGVDLIPAIAKIAEKEKYGIYILGSKPGVAREAAQALQNEFKDLKIAGTYHGYFLEIEKDKVIESINSSKAEILLVGMGFPKQEKFVSKNMKHLKVPVVMCVGGSIDVIARRVRRAPKWMRIAGLEWFYRLVSQPSRLSRMRVLPYFVYKVFLAGLKRHK